MSKTVIALFDDVGRAQHAYEALKVAGFADAPIEVHTGQDFVQHDRAQQRERAGPRSAIKSFFDELGLTTPEPPPGESERYPIGPGDRIIVLETSDDRADSAAAILDREGAVDVEERSRRMSEPRGASGRSTAPGARIYPPAKARTGDYVPRTPGDD